VNQFTDECCAVLENAGDRRKQNNQHAPKEGNIMTIASDRPARFSDEVRLEKLDRAKELLQGPTISAKEAYDLAEDLKNCNEFGYARKLFGRIRVAKDYTNLEDKVVKIGQRHALCTYKDTDLAVTDRFKRALEILDEVDRLKCEPFQQQESLGLRGAVYKRMWQVEGQRRDLLRSLAYYLKGFEIGPATDQGYTGINAAFVFDLLAREEAIEAEVTGTRWSVADDYWREGRAIRVKLAKLLPTLPERADSAWLKKEWWFFATLAEAMFGIEQFDGAIDALRGFNQENKLGHQEPPLEVVSPWEFETTISQLGTLAELQADIVERLSKVKDWNPPDGFSGDAIRDRARDGLRAYLGKYAEGVDRAFGGKLGLALSGGGFRASLFHIGVLARLAEQDILRRVEVLSCVSGGSIIGAHYYLELQHLLETKEDGEIKQKDYVELVKRVEKAFLAGVQTNIRCKVFGDILCNLRMFLQPGYTTTRRLAELYESEIYARIPDEKAGSPRLLKHLRLEPKGEGSHFKPKYDNWRRQAKVPELVLNATTLNTGRNWQFTASWMGEPPGRLDAEIGGNYLLRRMYHVEAPHLRDKWRAWFRRPFAPLDYQAIRVGEAVAASSCVPGLFEPLVLSDLFDGKRVCLVDGGVYDNQGVASLLEQDCNLMIVSDASGQMEAQDLPSGSRLGVPLRSFSISMARVRQAEFSELDARRRSGLLKGLMFLHLRKDLDAEALDWRECHDPVEASHEARPAARRGVRTSYKLSKEIQRLLSAIRTDLDSFTEVEAFALMTSGYYQTDVEMSKLPGVIATTRTEEPWRFLSILDLLEDGKGYPDLKKHLEIGRLIGGKVWRLDPVLMTIGAVILVAALGGLAWSWWTYQAVTLLTVGSLGVLAGALVLSALFPHVMQIVRYKKTFRDIGLRGLLGVALALGFKFHRRFLDRRFLKLGSLSRHAAARIDVASRVRSVHPGTGDCGNQKQARTDMLLVRTCPKNNFTKKK
jgi:predicted acylesterase/phospholipase RssA